MTAEDRNEEEALVEIAGGGALAAAEEFLSAIAGSDHRRCWEMLSENARHYVLEVGMEHGLPPDVALNVRQDNVDPDEMEAFTQDLLAGLRKDLEGIDPSRVALDSRVDIIGPLQARVRLLLEIAQGDGGEVTAVPVGSIVLAYEAEEWKVERLQPGRPEG